MLVHLRVTLSTEFTGGVRVNGLAQEHSVMIPAKVQTQTTHHTSFGNWSVSPLGLRFYPSTSELLCFWERCFIQCLYPAINDYKMLGVPYDSYGYTFSIKSPFYSMLWNLGWAWQVSKNNLLTCSLTYLPTYLPPSLPPYLPTAT